MKIRQRSLAQKLIFKTKKELFRVHVLSFFTDEQASYVA